MMITLKFIKSKDYELEVGVMTTVYTAAYKAQVFNIGKHDFDAQDLTVDVTAKTVKISCDVEMHKAPYLKNAVTGEIAIGFSLKPTMDIAVANWKS